MASFNTNVHLAGVTVQASLGYSGSSSDAHDTVKVCALVWFQSGQAVAMHNHSLADNGM